MAATEATVHRDGDALVFSGALGRDAAAALWTIASKALAGVQRIVLTNVTTVDSAGLALLAELAARVRAAGITPRIEGEPAGLSELRAAYRLTPGLDFPGAAPTT
ncbi:anti-sigma B factor antagonist [Pseudoxanthomonas yeongjuensis]|jgi:phospholipid transport system transporter-binding protein|uniref:STAS domain-containing protein n=1 Tax=Pseudoxanthomonas yeongjuensis TaxID=377616 RepID=UPI0013915DC5|nr:STAS domain-containing protein [Pseudoxanthomonas yeongjuensis]KAF1716662.1 anti-sigma B factor antagonist [Pseudoxanthomonas yeongjuensis]